MRVLVTGLGVVGLVALGLGLSPRVRAKDPEATTTAVTIATPREDVALEGVLHMPAQPSGVIVVIGSGRGYHMDLPLLKRTAEALQDVGIAALRFNWAYFTAQGKHAPDLATEIEDLNAAIAFAKQQPGIEHVVLAGKSLGSVAAALRARAKHDDLAGLMLLTFPVHPPEDPKQLTPVARSMQVWNKPLLIACGDADPYSLPGPLYRYVAGFGQAPKLVLAPGDHGFNGPGGREDEATTRANVALAAHGIARWARVWADALAVKK